MRKGSRPGTHERELKARVTADLELCGLLDIDPVLFEPTVNPPQAVLEIGLRLVMENPPSFLDGREEAVLLVPGPSFSQDDARGIIREGIDLVRQIHDSDFSARGEVDRFTDSLFRRGARQEPVHDVTDVGKVPCFFAGPRYGKRLTSHCPVEEVWNHIAVLPWHFSRAVRIEEPRIDDR